MQCALDSPDRSDERLHRRNNLLHSHVTVRFVLRAVFPNPLHYGDSGTKCYYTETIPAGYAGSENTICGWTRLQPKGRSEAGAVVEAPALLDLPRARGVGDVLLAGGAADIGARGQWRSLAPDGLRRAGIVHPDAIPEADFTADSGGEKHFNTRRSRFRCLQCLKTSVGGVLIW